ncbi:MAG TPA: ATP-binding cassette domain-containing protein [Polyangiaceae bacterium]|jgi:phospholipid/cholesterol/gamma-HCH transport system ATP-binding protein
MESGISLVDVSFGYGKSVVLRRASLGIPRGGTAVVAGRNGAGKSTLLYVCAGLLPVASGSVTIDGHAPDARHPAALMGAGVRRGFVFQEGGLLSNMNALANVALPLYYHADSLQLEPEQVEARARAALERVGLSGNELYELPAHLSFGVRKRLALARAIALEPNFFYFDDPDVGLDPATAALVHEILCGYRDDPAVTMLVATNRDLLIDRLGVPGYTLRDGVITPRSVPQPPPRLPSRLA